MIVDVRKQTTQEAIDNEFVVLPNGYERWPLSHKFVNIQVDYQPSSDKFVVLPMDFADGYEAFIPAQVDMEEMPF